MPQKIRGVIGYTGTFHGRGVAGSFTRRTSSEMPLIRKNVQKIGDVQRSRVSNPPWPTQSRDLKPMRVTSALMTFRPQVVPTSAIRKRVIAVCVSSDRAGTDRLGCQWLNQPNAG